MKFQNYFKNIAHKKVQEMLTRYRKAPIFVGGSGMVPGENAYKTRKIK